MDAGVHSADLHLAALDCNLLLGDGERSKLRARAILRREHHPVHLHRTATGSLHHLELGGRLHSALDHHVPVDHRLSLCTHLFPDPPQEP